MPSRPPNPRATPRHPAPDGPPAAPLLQGLPPVIDARTRLIVLGSFPGMASLQARQYYAHPRNQFWPLLSALWGVDLGALPYTQRLAAMLEHGLGLWDVYATCRRSGSLDSAITDAQINPLEQLKERAPQLQAVAHNGGESARHMKLTGRIGVPVWRLRITEALGLPVMSLPSTSPANASWSFERKLAAWQDAFERALGPQGRP